MTKALANGSDAQYRQRGYCVQCVEEDLCMVSATISIFYDATCFIRQVKQVELPLLIAPKTKIFFQGCHHFNVATIVLRLRVHCKGALTRIEITPLVYVREMLYPTLDHIAYSGSQAKLECMRPVMPDAVLDDISHRRYNPLKDSWILVSPHRTKRPWQWVSHEQ